MQTHPKPKVPGEDLFGLIVLVVSIALFWQSYKISGFEALSSPGAFPMAASAVMIFGSILIVIDNIRRNKAGAEVDRSVRVISKMVVLFLALIVAYALLLEPLGFLIASLLFLVAGMTLLYNGGFKKSLVIAVLVLALIYIVFRLVFQVVLPTGIIPEAQIMAAISDLFGGK